MVAAPAIGNGAGEQDSAYRPALLSNCRFSAVSSRDSGDEQSLRVVTLCRVPEMPTSTPIDSERHHNCNDDPPSRRRAPKTRAEEPPVPPKRRWPSDRTYHRLRWSAVAVCAAILAYGLVPAQFVPTPRGVGFRLVVLILMSFNILWWSVADRRLARAVRAPRRSRGFRLVIAACWLLLNGPVLHMILVGRSSLLQGLPTWYAAAIVLWHLSLVVLLPSVAVLRLGWLATLYGVHAVRASLRGTSRPAFVRDDAVDSGRRAVLRTAVATVPLTLLFGATAASRIQEGRLTVNRHSVPAPWLPRPLRGLTITHISDLHVGRHFRPSMLRQLVDKANALDSDLVVVTGDLVDHSNAMLPPTLHALKQLTHRHGLFACIGNHDEFDNRRDFIREVRAAVTLLVNERRAVEIGGERITLAGLDYASRDASSFGRNGHSENVARTLWNHDATAEGPVIALSHHPHAFDRLAAAGVPLTLAGHTHGGQLMLSAPDRRPDLGVGPLLFRYSRGFYGKPGRTLFVNRGVGNWFPLRLRAPAEIVQIRLT